MFQGTNIFHRFDKTNETFDEFVVANGKDCFGDCTGSEFFKFWDSSVMPEPSNVIPEPATILLFGLGGFGAFVRRKKRS